MANISLIPKGEKERAFPRLARLFKPQYKFGLGSKIGFILVVVAVLLSIGMLIWNSSLGDRKVLLTGELQSIKASRDTVAEKQIKSAAILLDSLGGLLENHRAWSYLFGIVEERTLKNVSFEVFEGDYQTGIFSLKGSAPNYNILAQQIRSLEQEEKISKIDVSEIELAKQGSVGFVILVTFDKTLLKRLPEAR